ncbi:MAG: 50S ribosomal protein L29 [Candidatus Parcubacteria bacterium]|nr:50S ribosomal protein L29 [Candidatus Parcubacteria bacterium]
MKVKEELKELKAKSKTELNKLLVSSREKLRELRFKVAQNNLKNIREVRVLKKKIAKLNTLLVSKGKEVETK